MNKKQNKEVVAYFDFERTFEELYLEESEKLERMKAKQQFPNVYLDAQITRENKLLAKGKGNEKRLAVLNALSESLRLETATGDGYVAYIKEERAKAQTIANTQNVDMAKAIEILRARTDVKDTDRRNAQAALSAEYARIAAKQGNSAVVNESSSEGKQLAARKDALSDAFLYRSDYLAARAAHLSVKPAPLWCFFSRNDILNYTVKKLSVSPYFADVILRQKPYLPDVLMCGNRVVAFLYERRGVLKLILRTADIAAKHANIYHSGVSFCDYPRRMENFYDVILDDSYICKDEAYNMLNEAYEYVYKRFADKALTDEDSKAEFEALLSAVVENMRTVDTYYEKAIANVNRAVAQHKMNNPSKVFGRGLLRRASQEKGVHVSWNKLPYMPSFLSERDEVFAFVVECSGEVVVTARCGTEFAEIMERWHPLTYSAAFPDEADWYCFHIDGTYDDESAYRILTTAREHCKRI